MIYEITEPFFQPVMEVWAKFSEYVPKLVAAFTFVLFGLFIARLASSLLEQFLSFVVYWALLLVFLVTAANILNLTVISEILRRFVDFLPNLMAAIFIGFGGLLFARFMADIVMSSAVSNNLRGGSSLSKIVHFVIVVFTLIAAIEQLGIKMKMIIGGINIMLASLGLAFAIAVGLGAKDIAHDVLRNLFTENKEEK